MIARTCTRHPVRHAAEETCRVEAAETPGKFALRGAHAFDIMGVGNGKVLEGVPKGKTFGSASSHSGSGLSASTFGRPPLRARSLGLNVKNQPAFRTTVDD